MKKPSIIIVFFILIFAIVSGAIVIDSLKNKSRLKNQNQETPVVQETSLAFGNGFLKVNGSKIVDADGKEMFLKGVNFGGWLMYEDWILKSSAQNFPLGGDWQNEQNIANYIDKKYDAGAGKRFFNGIRDNFITEKDFEELKSLGGNVVRVPIAYWLFDDETGFSYLDKALSWGEQNQVYVIIDMHAAPGCQSPAPFCIKNGQSTDFWSNPDSQEKTIDLWKKIASRYKNRTIIAGYDILNEPGISKNPNVAPPDDMLEEFYKRLISAIREIDSNHILFVEGNKWALDMSVFQNKWLIAADANSAYSMHLYKGSSCAPTIYGHEFAIEEFLKEQTQFIKGHNRPLFIGEWGGRCDSWVNAAVKVLKKNNIIFSAYFTWKDASNRPDSSGLAIWGARNPQIWNNFLSQLSLGSPVSSENFSQKENFIILATANFEAKNEYVSALRNYFVSD